MSDAEALREAILARLSTVIDPETGVDVVRMRLIEELAVDVDAPILGQLAAHPRVAGKLAADLLDQLSERRSLFASSSRTHTDSSASRSPGSVERRPRSIALNCASSKRPVHSSMKNFLNSTANTQADLGKLP